MKDITKDITEEEKAKDGKKLEKNIKILLKKKNEKKRDYYQERKQKLPEYRRNYHLTHKK